MYKKIYLLVSILFVLAVDTASASQQDEGNRRDGSDEEEILQPTKKRVLRDFMRAEETDNIKEEQRKVPPQELEVDEEEEEPAAVASKKRALGASQAQELERDSNSPKKSKNSRDNSPEEELNETPESEEEIGRLISLMHLGNRQALAELVKIANESKSPKAQYEIGLYYLNKAKSLKNTNEVKYNENLNLAKKWFEASNAESYKPCLNILGIVALEKGLYAQAHQYFTEAKEKYNDHSAIFNLGLMHHSGFGFPVNIKKAVIYYKQAAELGSNKALYQLAHINLHYKNLDLNLKGLEQLETLCQANVVVGDNESEVREKARQDIGQLRFHLAMKLIEGDADYEQNIQLAKILLSKASADHLRARFEYAKLLTRGDASREDLLEAYENFKALIANFPESQRLAEDIVLKVAEQDQQDLRIQIEAIKISAERINTPTEYQKLLEKAEKLLQADVGLEVRELCSSLSYMIAKNYQLGEGEFEQDLVKAHEYCDKASQQNHQAAKDLLPDLKYSLAKHYLENTDRSGLAKIAVRLLREAKALGNRDADQFLPNGLFILAQRCWSGPESASNYRLLSYSCLQEAAPHLPQAAQRLLKVEFWLGQRYLNGAPGYPQDFIKAIQMLEHCFENGNQQARPLLNQALYQHALIEINQCEDLQSDEFESKLSNSLRCLEQISVDHQNVRRLKAKAEYVLGMYRIREANQSGDNDMLSTGYQLLRKAARAQNPQAQFVLGKSLYYGEFFNQKSWQESIQWLEAAAGQGHAGAKELLPEVRFLHGKALYGNPSKKNMTLANPQFISAIHLFELSANDGYQPAIDILPEAYYQFGNALWSGSADNRNYSQGLAQYIKAAERGHAKAQFKAGEILLYGLQNLDRNYLEAIRWLQTAKHQHNDKAQDLLLIAKYKRAKELLNSGIEGNIVNSSALIEEILNEEDSSVHEKAQRLKDRISVKRRIDALQAEEKFADALNLSLTEMTPEAEAYIKQMVRTRNVASNRRSELDLTGLASLDIEDQYCIRDMGQYLKQMSDLINELQVSPLVVTCCQLSDQVCQSFAANRVSAFNVFHQDGVQYVTMGRNNVEKVRKLQLLSSSQAHELNAELSDDKISSALLAKAQLRFAEDGVFEEETRRALEQQMSCLQLLGFSNAGNVKLSMRSLIQGYGKALSLLEAQKSGLVFWPSQLADKKAKMLEIYDQSATHLRAAKNWTLDAVERLDNLDQEIIGLIHGHVGVRNSATKEEPVYQTVSRACAVYQEVDFEFAYE